MTADIRILSHSKGKYVRIFSLTIFSFTILFSQDELIHIRSIDSDTVSQLVNNMSEDISELSNRYELRSFSVNDSVSVFRVIKEEKLADSLLLNSDSDIQNSILEQILNPYRIIPIGDMYTQTGKDLVARYFFINEPPQYKFGLLGKDLLGAMIEFVPVFESQLSGIVGMNRVKNKWILNGESNLHLENYFKSAESIDLFWKRKDSISQVIRMGFSIPHPFGWNTGVSIKYHHEVFAGMYTIMENRFMANTFVPIFNNLGIGYVKGIISPTDKGVMNGFEKTDYQAFTLNTRMDNTNNRFLPTKGGIIDIGIDGGLAEGLRFIGSSYKMVKFYSHDKILFKLKWVGKGIYYHRSVVPKSRYEWFGGTSTIRGYDELVLSATQFQVISTEIGYVPFSKMQLTSFIDIGSDRFNILDESLIGYGVGLSQINEDSVLKIEYALSSTSMSRGKLHIKLISRL